MTETVMFDKFKHWEVNPGIGMPMPAMNPAIHSI